MILCTTRRSDVCASASRSSVRVVGGEYNIQYGASVSQELPYEINLTVGYTGSRGKDMFLRGVANTFDASRARQNPAAGQVDYKTSGCLDGSDD